jgi:hypothetical protein
MFHATFYLEESSPKRMTIIAWYLETCSMQVPNALVLLISDMLDTLNFQTVYKDKTKHMFTSIS